MKEQNEKINILSVPISTADRACQLRYLKERLSRGERTVVFTPNPQMLLRALRQKELRALLRTADVSLADGIGLQIAASIQKQPVPQRVAGIDAAEELLTFAAERGFSVFLLGGAKGRAHRAARLLQRQYSGLRIVGCHNGYFNKSGEDNRRVLRLIRGVRPDILFVCFGFPAQERWIHDNIDSLPSVRLAMGLGGSIDVWSGNVKRAPAPVREIGMEWLWRALHEPKRLKILLEIPQFLLCVNAQRRVCDKRK